MRYFDKYDEDNVVSKMLYVYFAFAHGSLGLFLILEDLERFNSKVLDAMGEVIPMPAWGLIFLIAAIAFILIAIQEGSNKSISMVVAGTIGALTFGLMSMASLELSVNQTNTMNYIFISSVDLLIATLGGVTLWKRRT